MSLSLPRTEEIDPAEREVVVRLLAAAAFVVFLQAYLMAPLIPTLMVEFSARASTLAWIVPAYMLPYGISTLFYGPLSDRIGRRPVLLFMLGAFCLFIAGSACAHTVNQLLAWRIAAGLASGGIIPISLALLADLFPYERRGRPVGWIFGAIAGGMAFGSTFGALLNPYLGWRVEFILVAAISVVLFALVFRHRHLLDGASHDHPNTLRAWISGYAELVFDARGSRTYAYIALNAAFHSGVFTWLGLYMHTRHQLGDRGIGLALLGYGVPGMLLGPALGHAADRLGRRAIIPAGMLLSALMCALLAPAWALWADALIITFLSFGYDMSHPLMTGIVTSLHPQRIGQALGFNAFVLFTGFGLGPLLLQWLIDRHGMAAALIAFAVVEGTLGLLSIAVFRGERSTPSPLR